MGDLMLVILHLWCYKLLNGDKSYLDRNCILKCIVKELIIKEKIDFEIVLNATEIMEYWNYEKLEHS
jgi:hypothetical protein